MMTMMMMMMMMIVIIIIMNLKMGKEKQKLFKTIENIITCYFQPYDRCCFSSIRRIERIRSTVR